MTVVQTVETTEGKTLFVLTTWVALLGVFIIVEYLSSSDRPDRFHSGRLRHILTKHRRRKIDQSTYDWSVGGNEIRQYRQFMWQNPHFRLKLVDEPITLEFDPNYYYNVKHVGTDVIAENGVSVSIEERYRKTTTSGGSCFYVFSETASFLFYCSTRISRRILQVVIPCTTWYGERPFARILQSVLIMFWHPQI